MIKKRYLTILSLAAVSVLLGSLLYNHLVLAGKPQPEPQICKDAVEIDVFGWVTRQYASSGESREWGVWVEESYPANLAFIFSPEKSSFNITKILVVIYATNRIENFRITINDDETYFATINLGLDLPTAKRFQLDPNLVQINEGINLLKLSGAVSGWLSVYEVSLFIEYEYEA